MEVIVKSVIKLLPFGQKTKKYLPFFIGFKLLTFTGFLTYIMNRWIISLALKEIWFTCHHFGISFNFDIGLY